MKIPKKTKLLKKTRGGKTSAKQNFAARNESSLHHTLKFRYAGPGGKTEVETGSFVADGRRGDGEYIEVQTGSFGPLKKKIEELSSRAKVRIIHPVAAEKKIEVFSKKGKLLYRRKSPKKGSPWDFFDALLYAPCLPLLDGVSIEIAMVIITEKRVKDGKGAWRRNGISIRDRELAAWQDSILLEKPKDYLRFVPFKKREEFTSSLLAERAGVDRLTAGKALYVLTKMKVVKRKGKKGNSWVYSRML